MSSPKPPASVTHAPANPPSSALLGSPKTPPKTPPNPAKSNSTPISKLIEAEKQLQQLQQAAQQSPGSGRKPIVTSTRVSPQSKPDPNKEVSKLPELVVTPTTHKPTSSQQKERSSTDNKPNQISPRHIEVIPTKPPSSQAARSSATKPPVAKPQAPKTSSSTSSPKNSPKPGSKPPSSQSSTRTSSTPSSPQKTVSKPPQSLSPSNSASASAASAQKVTQSKVVPAQSAQKAAPPQTASAPKPNPPMKVNEQHAPRPTSPKSAKAATGSSPQKAPAQPPAATQKAPEASPKPQAATTTSSTTAAASTSNSNSVSNSTSNAAAKPSASSENSVQSKTAETPQSPKPPATKTQSAEKAVSQPVKVAEPEKSAKEVRPPSQGSQSSSNSSNSKRSNIPLRKKEPEVPASELSDEMKTRTFNISTLFRMTFADVTIELSPSFVELEPKEYNTAFAQKVKECKKLCDWSIGIKDVEAKKNKKILLIQLIELFESNVSAHYIMPGNIDKFISMVVRNISRPFPNQKPAMPFDFDDVTQDMAWPHLALVYEALLKLLMSTLTIKINHPTFIACLVSNSCSPDERERMAVRDNLKFLFAKCEDVRDQILRLVENQFLTGICSHQLLEFMLSVLDEVGRPLPDNLIKIYKESVLFLHSSPVFLTFYKAFFACVNRFVRCERSLLKPTIEFLVRHWPSSTVRKQLIFMSEMEGLTLNYFEDVTEDVAKMVFKKLSDLVNEPNIDIAETALNVLLGPALEEPLVNFPELAIKTMTQELMNSANKNWNEFVQEDSKLALQMLSDLNPKIFKATVGRLKEERKRKKTYQGIWRTNWKKVVETAKMNDDTITSANMDMLF
ncbi:hypothetical protein TRFO_10312 [Tritrichomonas foetus]|uniref:Phosphoprotein phosphatase n=1 Tax=Tritrichomonas foetus TaxID=1144522 RepID=A0A1J4J9M8_9EUKA|nr:hypothetical protein TRFO_10312 [Tritrichomonas foetus]|eukprot:OHS95898.1 hypothetical protein TRFO_10312 [Tritrichomonas foetus]